MREKRKSRREDLKQRAVVCLVCCIYFFKQFSVKSFFKIIFPLQTLAWEDILLFTDQHQEEFLEYSRC